MENGLKVIAQLLATMAFVGLACGQSPIKGTYEIELEIAGASRPLAGTLILSTRPLDLSSGAGDDDALDFEWFGDDVHSANSCFILSANRSLDRPGEKDPGVVRVFETSIRSDGLALPIEILHASDLRIEIVKLQFFANALGGELEVHVDTGTRPGRIVGARMGEANPQDCVVKLEEFRAYLKNLSAAG